jgi:glycosyltransferase involved in cell wall biosynthesis
LPISTFLAARVKERAPGKPFLKIPILSDTTEPWPTKNNLPIPSFLYCGSGTYLELIRFILDSFTLVANTATFIDLVVSGDPKEMEAFDELIVNHPLKDQIRTYSNLSYAHLCQLYVDATALLIPLRASIQDQARFPHKIGEYLASGNPVITTNYGEIPFYFEDLETALVAKEYSPSSFAEKMIYVLDHPEQATQIGLRGKKFAGVEFAYEKHGLALLSFIETMR